MPAIPAILDQPLKAVMKTDVPLIKKEEPLIKAISLMQKTGVHFLPVVDGLKTLVGALSVQDMLKAFQVPSALGESIKLSEEFFTSGLKRTVEELMIAPPIKLAEEDTVADAIRVCTNNRIAFVPVINKEAIFLGLVSLVDIFSLVKD